MDQVAAAAGERAVLAELRAIGLSFAASAGVLRPVQAREVRGLAKRLVGSTDLLGQVFRWEGEDYLVNDIAPGPTPVSDIGERSEGCRLHTNGVQRCGTSVPEAWSFRPRPRG